MSEPKPSDRTKPTPVTYPNPLTEILIKLDSHQREEQRVFDERYHRSGALRAQENPRLDECTAQEKAKALETLRQFDQGEMSLSELEARSPVLSNLCASHGQELLDEPPKWINSPVDYVVLESEIHGSPLDAKALNDYLALIQTALKMGADASKLKIHKMARRGIAVALARLDRDDAFMERLIGGLWEKYPDVATEAELSKVGEKAGGRKRKKDGRKRRSPQQCRDDNAFYDGWKKSRMTLPEYSREKNKTRAEGDKIRARVEAERRRTNAKPK